jgi:tetratricopeptide (TPR) repeat protein
MMYNVMFRRYVLPLLLAIPGWVAAQDRQSLLAEADQNFAQEGYARAAMLYEIVLKKQKNKEPILRKLAQCYTSTNAYASAAAVYKKLTAMENSSTADWTMYGDMLKSMGLYEEAKAAYAHVPSYSVNANVEKIAGCDSAMRWKTDSVPQYTLRNMEKINTGMSDWGAVYDPVNNSNIVFVSAYGRKEALGPKTEGVRYSDKRTSEFFSSIYVLDSSRHDVIHGLAPAFYSFKFHTGPVVFSPDQKTAYLTVTNTGKISYAKKDGIVSGKRRLSLQMLDHKNGQWIAAKGFSHNKPASYSIGHAAISSDGKVLYFTSDMPGGYGKTDIWYASLKPDGSWDIPQNCGPLINTAEEDDFPTVNDADGIYFSSKGHLGMGGLDVFYVRGEKNNWQKPQNMRWPVNSEGDDFYFILKNKNEGLLSSNRTGGKGSDDIYGLLITGR